MFHAQFTRPTRLNRGVQLARTLVLAGLVVCGGVSQAAVYNAVTDFSTTTNTASSTCSYRVSSGLAHDGSYKLLPKFGPFKGFTGPAADTAGWAVAGVPAMGLNRSGADQFFIRFGPGAQFTWPAGSLYMHPGPSALARVSWLRG